MALKSGWHKTRPTEYTSRTNRNPPTNFTFRQMVNHQISFFGSRIIREGNKLEVKVYKKLENIHYATDLKIMASLILVLIRWTKLVYIQSDYLAQDLNSKIIMSNSYLKMK